jgi:DNA-binding MltR family transcriptional regulator
LLQSDGPLGCLSARIEISYRLGLLSETLYRDLCYVRKIRNKFAHSAGASFSEPSVKDLTRELVIPKLLLKARPDITGNSFFDSPREIFSLSAVVLMVVLSGLVNQIKRVETSKEEIDYVALAAGLPNPDNP